MAFSVTDILEEFSSVAHMSDRDDWGMFVNNHNEWGGMHVVDEDRGQKSERQRRARQANPELHKRLDHERYMARRDAALAQQWEYYKVRGRILRKEREARAVAARKMIPKRPQTKITPEILDRVIGMLAEGKTISYVSRNIPLARSCIHSILKRANK